MSEPIIPAEKLVYETHEYRGYRIKAFYLASDRRDARIEIWKGDEIVKDGTAPAYKIWNYSAHYQDIVDDYLAEFIESSPAPPTT